MVQNCIFTLNHPNNLLLGPWPCGSESVLRFFTAVPCCPELYFVLLSLRCTGSKVDFNIKSKVLHLEIFVVCIFMKNSVSGTFLTVVCLIRVPKSWLSLTCFVLHFWFSQHHLHCKDFAVFRNQMGTIPILNCALWDTVVHRATFVCSPYFV